MTGHKTHHILLTIPRDIKPMSHIWPKCSLHFM